VNSTFKNAAGKSSGNGSTLNDAVHVNQNQIRKSSVSPASALPLYERRQSALLVVPPAKRARVDNIINSNCNHKHKHVTTVMTQQGKCLFYCHKGIY
jgi:hypothetical protein